MRFQSLKTLRQPLSPSSQRLALETSQPIPTLTSRGHGGATIRRTTAKRCFRKTGPFQFNLLACLLRRRLVEFRILNDDAVLHLVELVCEAKVRARAAYRKRELDAVRLFVILQVRLKGRTLECHVSSSKQPGSSIEVHNFG